MFSIYCPTYCFSKIIIFVTIVSSSVCHCNLVFSKYFQIILYQTFIAKKSHARVFFKIKLFYNRNSYTMTNMAYLKLYINCTKKQIYWVPTLCTNFLLKNVIQTEVSNCFVRDCNTNLTKYFKINLTSVNCNKNYTLMDYTVSECVLALICTLWQIFHLSNETPNAHVNLSIDFLQSAPTVSNILLLVTTAIPYFMCN